MHTMTLGTSTFLVAVGAIMRYAITARATDWNVPMVGGILMLVGLVGAAIAVAMYVTAGRRRSTLVRTPGSIDLESNDIR